MVVSVVRNLSHNLLPLLDKKDGAFTVQTDNIDVFVAKLVVGNMHDAAISFDDSHLDDVIFPKSARFLGEDLDPISLVVILCTCIPYKFFLK